MGETIPLDDYTTLPGKSGATLYFPMHRRSIAHRWLVRGDIGLVDSTIVWDVVACFS